MTSGDYVTFVVRLSRADGGRLDGVVERVKTGEKARFQELTTVGAIIARMLDGPGGLDDPRSIDTRRTRT